MTVDVSVVVGTRPEAIKCAPVILELRARGLNVRLVSSGQHADLLSSTLRAFDLKADIDLQAMTGTPDLSALTTRLIERIGAELSASPPYLVLVQGDTTTALAAALSAFYSRVPCGHIEAGLRSGRLDAPWPEEMNRIITDRLCTRHYAPTEGARTALQAEGIAAESILVTGQTGVDAAVWMAARQDAPSPRLMPFVGKRLIYVTAHRRENQGGRIADTLRGVCAALDKHTDCTAVLSAHPNPIVQAEVAQVRHERLVVVPPLDYADSIWMLVNSAAVVSDSGGIQEEAPSFGTPVLVARDVTERPEGLAAGFIRMVGTQSLRVEAGLTEVLADSSLRNRLKAQPNPYGDGRAAGRIADDVLKLLGT
ncbi:MAG: UDP-N-acetylglucosamine 2-epimerase (non-hydrolyzing) [Planctomycetes bacterium]|nr:UDP-N-acetylglucosamine 2-epimerase (non-hydrolyzing) [Planctomycetota bacterium]